MKRKRTIKPPQKIKNLSLGCAANALPVTYSRHPEDGFLMEDPRPQHSVVLVTLESGVRFMKEGGNELLMAVQAAGVLDLSEDGWVYQGEEYGSEAWHMAQQRREYFDRRQGGW